MDAYGIDIRGRRSKPLSEFEGEHFDSVVSLCDRVRERCPEFPGAPDLIHWSTADPARADEPTWPAFERVAAQLETRIRFFIDAINATTPQEVTERV
jgi:protein-tyrosine-phosphatase